MYTLKGKVTPVFLSTYTFTTQRCVPIAGYSRFLVSLCVCMNQCVCLCVNPSVAHTTKQWSPKQSADMSPGVPAPRPLASVGV